MRFGMRETAQRAASFLSFRIHADDCSQENDPEAVRDAARRGEESNMGPSDFSADEPECLCRLESHDCDSVRRFRDERVESGCWSATD